jgi:16S rRNA (guanine527-N7)-methyltransferase
MDTLEESLAGFTAGAADLGIQLESTQQAAFQAYHALLSAWNCRFNLVGPAAAASLWSGHFLDALTIVRAVPRGVCASNTGPSFAVLDVGSGAGLPGIPLQIAFPRWHVTLLEVTTKKVRFLEYAVRELDLHGTTVVQGRAEEVAHDPAHRGKYDLCVARAVARTAALLEITVPFVPVGGHVVLYKTMVSLRDELQQAEPARTILGAGPAEVIPVLPGEDDGHCLVRYHTVARTPAVLPRRAGMPEHHPLTVADCERIGAAEKLRQARP